MRKHAGMCSDLDLRSHPGKDMYDVDLVDCWCRIDDASPAIILYASRITTPVAGYSHHVHILKV